MYFMMGCFPLKAYVNACTCVVIRESLKYAINFLKKQQHNEHSNKECDTC